VLKAMEDARRILVENIAGPRDATQTVRRLLAVFDQVEVVCPLDRINGAGPCSLWSRAPLIEERCPEYRR